MNLPILCIMGATASGKSAVAMQIARDFSTCIISADSMQIYKGMDIGTAKPTQAEQNTVKHYMIDVVEPSDEYNAFMYLNDVDKILQDKFFETHIPLMVGGTGLYFESVIFGLDYALTDDMLALRKELWAFYQLNGAAALHKKLKNLNLSLAEKIHENNVKSVIRAIEKLSFEPVDISRTRLPQKDCCLCCLSKERHALYESIDNRVDAMISDGLIDEVSRLSVHYSSSCQAFQAIGYKEVIEYINGHLSREDMIEVIKKNTRNYAKRQITFFKRLHPNYIDVDGKDTAEITKEIIDKYKDYIKEKNILIG